MGVTKADKHCDLGCRFTESPDCKKEGKKVCYEKQKIWLCLSVFVCVCLPYLCICVCVALL